MIPKLSGIRGNIRKVASCKVKPFRSDFESHSDDNESKMVTIDPMAAVVEIDDRGEDDDASVSESEVREDAEKDLV